MTWLKKRRRAYETLKLSVFGKANERGVKVYSDVPITNELGVASLAVS